MKILATIALSTALTTMTNAEVDTINLSAMTCRDFVQTDPVKVNLVIAWFMGFYGNVQDPQVIDLNKLEDVRGQFIAFCKQEPNFRMTATADGLLGSPAEPQATGAAHSRPH
jgi:acid stress chaperone HdeB